MKRYFHWSETELTRVERALLFSWPFLAVGFAWLVSRYG